MNNAKIIVAVLALVSLSFSADVLNCSVLDIPGETYVLANNLAGAPIPAPSLPGAACMKITAPGVTLDCNGFNIANNGTAGTTAGVLLTNVTNVTVKNCPGIARYTYGVFIESSNHNTLTNISSINNTGQGFQILSGSGNALSGNLALGNGFFVGGSGNLLSGNIVSNAGLAFLIPGSNHTFSGNTVSNSSIGFAGASSSGHTVTNNLVFNVPSSAFILGSNNILAGNTAMNNAGYTFFGPNNVLVNNSGGAFSFSGPNNTLINNSGNRFGFESSNNRLTNNTATGSPSGGGISFDFISGNNNVLIGNTARNNPLIGFFFRDGIGNILLNNRALNNGRGLQMSQGFFNSPFPKNTQMYCNVFCNNSANDVEFSGGTNNSGADNKCNAASNWNDTGTVGCSHSCDEAFTCENDLDFDRVLDGQDNCPSAFNPGQADFDNDGIGDACDDSDGDGAVDSEDKCVAEPGSVQGCPPCPSPLATPGETFTLTHNLVGAPNSASGAKSCITIAASNVKVNCNGFTIMNSGIFIDNGVIIDNSFDRSTVGILASGSLTNVTVENCSVTQYESGVRFDSVNDSVLRNNHAFNNVADLVLVSSSGNTAEDNDARISVVFSSKNRLERNTGGVSLFSSSGNTVSGNSGSSFSLGSSSHNNTLVNNLGGSFSVVGCSNNSFINNTASNAFEGFNVGEGSGNTFMGNTASGLRRGFRIGPTAVRDVFIGNNASNNTFEGFEIFGSLNNFSNNTASFNGGSGFQLSSGALDTFSGNLVFRNARGFFLSGTGGILLLNNTIFNNSGSGLQIGAPGICCSLNTSLRGDHFSGNHPDLHVEIAAFSPGIPAITLSDVIFDSPAGNLTNYTTLSLSDALSGEPQAVYDISWTGEPALPPVGFRSFAGKYVSISANSDLTTIDNASWHWLDSEQGDEGTFRVWKYNGTWTDMNATLDSAANTLFVSNLKQPSVFGVLQDNPDNDFDGVCNPGRISPLCTGSDLCPGSVPDMTNGLNPRHYAQTIGFAEFEVGPGNEPSVVYTQEVTKGCTCSQIADKLGGNKKKGCPREIMEQWTGVSAQPDWDAGIGAN